MNKLFVSKKRCLIFIIIISIFISNLGFATGGKGDGSGEGYKNPLALESSNLKDGDQNISLSPVINLVFNKNVVHMSVKKNNIDSISIEDNSGKSIAILVEMADDQVEPNKRREIIVKPVKPLVSNTKYTLNIKSTLGSKSEMNLSQPIKINFTTKSIPSKYGFMDTNNHWAKKHIDLAVKQNLIIGINENEFAPDKTINRAELSSIINKMINLSSTKDLSEYKDFNKKAWYATDMEKVINAGILAIKNNKVAASEIVTREEISDAFAKVAEYKNIKLDKSSKSAFNDKSDINLKYLPSVNGLYNLKVISGKSDNLFAPKDKVTRAETVVMALRLMEQLGK